MSLIDSVIKSAENVFKVWPLKDIFTGPNGTGRYVPNVGDLVVEIVGRVKKEWVVSFVDPNTNLSLLTALSDAADGQATNVDVLFAPTTQTYRLLIDQSVTPHLMRVDSRCHIHAKDAAYCKIFAGRSLGNSGSVISAKYNSSGVYVGENLDLVLVANDRYANNTGIFSVQPGHTNEELNDGDVATAIFYSVDGTRISTQDLIVQNTSWMVSLDTQAKAVQSIGLKCPFINAANSSVINYPLNLPLNALNLIGVVNYSDGSRLEMAVDGTRFTVEGLDAYAPTTPGQTTPLTLKYRLQTNEIATGTNPGAQGQFSQNYTIVTSASDGTYAVHLVCYPEWISAGLGYRLTWRLYDLNRSIDYDVTDLVQIDVSQGQYVGNLYGTKQRLAVSLNLKSVNAQYNAFVHVQIVDVILNAPGTNRPPKNGLANWQVTPTANSTPLFGNAAYSTFYVSGSTSTVKISGDFDTLTAWLAGTYRASKPIFNPQFETRAPEPTHFKLVVGASEWVYPISQWSDPLPVNTVLINNQNVSVVFIKRTAETDLLLGRVAMPAWKIDLSGAYL